MSNSTSAAFIFNVFTLFNSTITSFVSLFVLFIFIFRGSLLKDVRLLLCANTYLAILAYSLVSGSLYIDTLRGDLRSTFEIQDSILCRIRGSIVLSFLSAIFGAFCLQAIFRLSRVVYRRRLILQKIRMYFVLILIQWLLSFTFVWLVNIEYLPTEYYCSIPFDSLTSVLVASLIAYGLPSFFLAFIYYRIVVYIRHHRIHRRRNGRDLVVIRRIMIVVSALWLLGIPSMILAVYGQIKGKIHPLTYRLEWIMPSMAMATLSIVLVLFDPHLTRLVCSKRCHTSPTVQIHVQLTARHVN